MRILLANDDGYDAYGIYAIARALSQSHQVTVVAPKHNKSCASHSATFFKPMTAKRILDYDWTCYSLDGTPVDCVMLGLVELGKTEQFDLVITGINDVPNLGSDVIYSGTVQQAIEAERWGVPAIAVSGNLKDTANIDKAAQWVADNIDYLYKLSKICSISVNIPRHVREDYAYRIAPLGVQFYDDHYLSQVIDDTTTEYTLVGQVIKDKDQPFLSDISYYAQGYVAISPIKLLFNEDGVVDRLKEVQR